MRCQPLRRALNFTLYRASLEGQGNGIFHLVETGGGIWIILDM